MKKVLGQYEISYSAGVVQQKNLIKHEDFENIIKPTLDEIERLEVQKKKDEASEKKVYLKSLFGENWFTNKSPLYEAIETGVIELLPQQGGSHNASIKKINPNQ